MIEDLAEASLEQSEALFQQLFEESADAKLFWKDGIFTNCNRAAIEMMRCQNKAELLSLHPAQLSPDLQPDGRSSFEKANEMAALALAEGNHRFEWLYRRRDGEEFWVEVLLTRVHWDGVHFLHTTWRDISDRKAAEAALAEKEAQYRSIFEAINDGVFISDLETGNLVTVNPAACEMHGHDYEEFITLAPPQYIHPDSLCLFSQFLEMSRTGKRFFCEAVDVHKDGTLIDVEVTAVPFLYGNKPHILSLVRDIRDRKRTETTLQQKAQELEQALQDLQRTQLQMIQAEKMSSLGQLVAGIAHEINNPVNFIYGNIVPTHQYTQDLLKLIEL